MHHYRLYFLDQRSGHILRAADYEAVDDAEALLLAREQQGAHPLELWCGARRVAEVEIAAGAGRRSATEEA